MKLVKIKISSASTAFRPRPEFNDEVEQRVTIHASGRVRVQRILFGDETVDNVVASNEEFRIPQGDAEEILETCAGYFQYWETPEITTDIGGWKLTMTDDEGQKYRAAGPIEGEYKLGDKDLNQLIREKLERRYGLWLFDGRPGKTGWEEGYILLTVEFVKGGKRYYYLTDDPLIEEGDRVVVPIDVDLTKKVAVVVEKTKFTKDQAPLVIDDFSAVFGKASLFEEPKEKKESEENEARAHVVIRPFKGEDAKEAAQIWNEVVDAGNAFPQIGGLKTPEEAEDFFRAQYTAVAELDGEIVGLYILHPNNIGRVGHIANASYAVKSSCRGLHLGELLVKDCLKQAKALGYQILQFNAVVASNVHAYHLYLRLGFTDLGIIPGGFKNKEGEYEDIHVMYRLLAGE